VDLLAEFLSKQDWPYHVGGTPDAARVRAQAAAGYYDNDETRTFWIVNGDGTKAGLIRLLDLADDTPMFDLRIGVAYRGTGLGTAALRWLTGYLFTEFPVIRRIEGNTRQDNQAMRHTFRSCGYVMEAHYRQAWPAFPDASTTPSATRSCAPTGRPARSPRQTGTTSNSSPASGPCPAP
jgi:RimJ/RimL family protein N-acetyltransferase